MPLLDQMRRAHRDKIRQYHGLRFLLPHQIKWLTGGQTLRQQVSMSLKDRVRHFQKEFPSAMMNPTLLRKIYKLHKIKKKKYRWHKSPKELDPEKQKT